MSSFTPFETQIERVRAAASKHAARSTLDQEPADDGGYLIEVTGPERDVLFAISPTGKLFYAACFGSGEVRTQEELEQFLEWVDYPVSEGLDESLAALRGIVEDIVNGVEPEIDPEMQELLEKAVAANEETKELSPEEWADLIVSGDGLSTNSKGPTPLRRPMPSREGACGKGRRCSPSRQGEAPGIEES